MFHDREAVHKFFTRLSGLLKGLNYEKEGDPSFERVLVTIEEHIESVGS